MKPEELTPKSLLQFFAELETSTADDEECEIHYGCSCVIEKGRRAAQMLVDIQQMLGSEAGGSAPKDEEEARISAQIMEVEAALLQSDDAADPGASAEELNQAEAEIDRLLVQNVDLKDENGKLKEKIRDLYKQIERLYTRSEMTKLLDGLEEREAREKEEEAKAAATEDNATEEPEEAVEEEAPAEEARVEADAEEEVADEGGAEEDAAAADSDADEAEGEPAGDEESADSAPDADAEASSEDSERNGDAEDGEADAASAESTSESEPRSS